MPEVLSVAPSSEQLMSTLTSMELAGRASNLPLPLSNKEVYDWSGLAYKLAQLDVVSPMREINEMLAYPDNITPVPGTQSWFLGVTNLRGHLLSVLDLAMYLGLQQTPINKATRMLVMRMQDMYVGLVVSAVRGIRHFAASEHVQAVNQSIDPNTILSAYVSGLCKTKDGEWPLFDLHILATDERFRNAALV